MNINPMNYNNINQMSFGHGHSKHDSGYTKREKAIIAGTTALGITTSLACLAKYRGYSLNPKRMFSNLKNSYFMQTKILAPEIISIGAGTCMGGLIGGCIVDQDKVNRRAKQREAVMQMGNISIPILTVAGFNKICEKHGKIAQAVGSIAGIFTGVYIANFLMNKLSNKMFHNKDERGVKVIDFSAHVDDILGSAQYISSANAVKYISRVVPAVLMLPGMEVGTKKAGDNQKSKTVQ